MSCIFYSCQVSNPGQIAEVPVKVEAGYQVLPASPSLPITRSFWLAYPTHYPKLLQPKGQAALPSYSGPYITQLFQLCSWPKLSLFCGRLFSPPLSPHMALLRAMFTLDSSRNLSLPMVSNLYLFHHAQEQPYSSFFTSFFFHSISMYSDYSNHRLL